MKKLPNSYYIEFFKPYEKQTRFLLSSVLHHFSWPGCTVALRNWPWPFVFTVIKDAIPKDTRSEASAGHYHLSRIVLWQVTSFQGEVLCFARK